MGARFVFGLYFTEQVLLPDMELPRWIVFLCALPLGSYLMCFRFLQVAWTFARTGALPHHDADHVEGIQVEAEGICIRKRSDELRFSYSDF